MTTQDSKKGRGKKGKTAKKGRREKGGKEKKGQQTSRIGKGKKSDVDEGSSATLKKSLPDYAAEKEASYEFVGYDLGRLRVQVTNRVETFLSADGTLVRAEMDDWLYKNKDLRITVTIRDNSLRLFPRIGTIGSREANEVFHLTSKTGIIVGFQKLPEPQRKVSKPPKSFECSSDLTARPDLQHLETKRTS